MILRDKKHFLILAALGLFLIAGAGISSAQAQEESKKSGWFGLFNSSKDSSKPIHLDQAGRRSNSSGSTSAARQSARPYQAPRRSTGQSSGMDSFAAAMQQVDAANKQKSDIAAAERQKLTDRVIAQDLQRIKDREKEFQENGVLQEAGEERRKVYKIDGDQPEKPPRLFNIR